MKNILVTGPTGFIGKKLVSRLVSDSYNINATSRTRVALTSGVSSFNVGELNSDTDWKPALREVECVIHVAALSHCNIEDKDHLREVNVNGTINLARQAAENGIIRFLFISSIKVNGESTSHKAPYSPIDTPAPLDAYGASKAEAEDELLKIGKIGRAHV